MTYNCENCPPDVTIYLDGKEVMAKQANISAGWVEVYPGTKDGPIITDDQHNVITEIRHGVIIMIAHNDEARTALRVIK